LHVSEFLADCMEEYLEGENRGKIAYKLINYVAKGFAEIVRSVKGYPVVMSGGVCYNSYFTPLVEKYVGKVYVNEKVACGDNGISFGQAYIGRFLNDF